MSAQVQFGGTIPFRDRSTGSTVQVRVWGAFVGQGADAHEVAAIQQWIMNALSTSAQSYDGAIHDLPAKAAEWGGYVSQQLAPQLAQQFQAHGQIQIQGVAIEGADPAKAAAMKAPMAMGAAPMAMGGADPGAIERAANALATQMGVPLDQARHAAQIVAQALGVGGGVAAAGTPAYKQAYEKQQQNQKPGYDAKGQPLAGYDQKGQPAYDQKGQPTYDAKGQPQYGYDQKGQPQYGYDQKGQPQHGYDQKGQPQHGYDQKGQPQHGYGPGGKDPGQWKK